MKLSNQAVGALMMALQRYLMEQSDIVPVLKGFNFTLEGEELTVDNPPSFKLDEFGPWVAAQKDGDSSLEWHNIAHKECPPGK